MSFHPDPEIAAEIEACAREAEAYDMSVGLPPHRWTCDCGASHSRGHFLSIGVHRCLGCGYVGDGGSIVRFDDDDRALLSGTGRNDVSTEDARLGVPVWRVIIDDRAIVTDDPRIADAYSHSDSRARIVEPGLWFATTPEARQALHDALLPILFDLKEPGNIEIDAAESILELLGF